MTRRFWPTGDKATCLIIFLCTAIPLIFVAWVLLHHMSEQNVGPFADAKRNVSSAAAAEDPDFAVRLPMVCHGKLLEAEDHQYCVYDDKMSWQSGRLVCAASGGHLLEFDDRQQAEFIYQQLGTPTHSTGERYFVGASDLAEEGVWRWVDGSPVEDPQWLPGEPSPPTAEEDCVEWRNDSGRWNDVECRETQFRYVCEQIPPTLLRCKGERFQSSAGTDFCASTDMVNWHGAKETCAEDGGRLAVLDDPEDRQALVESLSSHNYWLGRTDRDVEGQWKGVSGHATNYANWTRNQPNDDLPGNDCARWWAKTGQWQSVRCNEENRIVCVTHDLQYKCPDGFRFETMPLSDRVGCVQDGLKLPKDRENLRPYCPYVRKGYLGYSFPKWTDARLYRCPKSSSRTGSNSESFFCLWDRLELPQVEDIEPHCDLTGETGTIGWTWPAKPWALAVPETD